MTAPTEEGTVELPKFPLSIPDVHALIREAGGIVHSDGNIFFTRAEQFIAAAVSCGEVSRSPVVGAVGGEPTELHCTCGNTWEHGLHGWELVASPSPASTSAPAPVVGASGSDWEFVGHFANSEPEGLPPHYAPIQAKYAHEPDVVALYRKRGAPDAANAGEPQLWQYRWTNPGGDPVHQPDAMKWQPVEHPHWQTLEQKLDELRAYRYQGVPCYEVRALYAATPTGVAADTLCAAIMNLPCKPPTTTRVLQGAYMHGHRDARHAAAELVAAADESTRAPDGPFYISGPYPDGSYSICELATARIVQKLAAEDFPVATGVPLADAVRRVLADYDGFWRVRPKTIDALRSAFAGHPSGERTSAPAPAAFPKDSEFKKHTPTNEWPGRSR